VYSIEGRVCAGRGECVRKKRGEGFVKGKRSRTLNPHKKRTEKGLLEKKKKKNTLSFGRGNGGLLLRKGGIVTNAV